MNLRQLHVASIPAIKKIDFVLLQQSLNWFNVRQRDYGQQSLLAESSNSKSGWNIFSYTISPVFSEFIKGLPAKEYSQLSLWVEVVDVHHKRKEHNHRSAN